MNSDSPLDYAIFQLSPKRSRCELVVSGDGKTEKLASGLFKPFLTHLKAAEEQSSQSSQFVKLYVEKKRGNTGSWFHKGTLERFVRFVSTPEVLEAISTLDAETSQLEGAKRIYCQGGGDSLSGTFPGENETAEPMPGDATKKELLRAIDVRLSAVKQELTSACARASSAGFNLESISDLRLFADYFGAQRLNSACSKFLSLCQRRPELITRPHEYYQHNQQLPLPSSSPITQKTLPSGAPERDVRGSSGSDMSIDDSEDIVSNTVHPSLSQTKQGNMNQNTVASRQQSQHFRAHALNLAPNQDQKPTPAPKTEDEPAVVSRRLSVQDRISMFESKQKEQSGSKGSGKAELRRLSSDPSLVAEKAAVRRWSGASDMSLDLSGSNGNICSHKESEIESNEEKDTANSQPSSASASLENPKEHADSLSHSVASLRLTEDSEFTGQLSDQVGLKSSLVVNNEEIKATVSSSTLQQKPFLTHFKASESSKIVAMHSQAQQKIPKDGEAHSPSRGKYFSRKPEKLGKTELDSDSKDKNISAPSLQKGLRSRISERFHIQANQHVNDEVPIKSDMFDSSHLNLESSYVQGHSTQKHGLSDESQISSESPKLSSLAHSSSKNIPKKPEKLGRLELDSDSKEKLISAPSLQPRIQSRVNERPHILATQDAKEEVPTKSALSSSTFETSYATGPSNQNQGLDEELQNRAEYPKLVPHGKTLPKKHEKLRKATSDSESLGIQLSVSSQTGFQGRVNERVDIRTTEEPSDSFDPSSSTVELSYEASSSKVNQGLNGKLRMKAESRKLDSRGKFSSRKPEKLDKPDLDMNSREKLLSPVQFGYRVNERVDLDEASQDLNNEMHLTSDGNDLNSLSGTEANSAARSSRGNQGLNEELQMKADELEKIFAAHKLRLQADQTSTSMRSKAAEHYAENERSTERIPYKKNESDQTLFTDSARKFFSDPSFSEDSKGKFYEKYMQKREAKLREDWDSKRDQKEAKMKKMHDDLERSRAEMARFSGSSRRLDSRISYHSRAEQLRSYSFNLPMTNNDTQVNDNGKSIVDEANLVNNKKNFGCSQSMRNAVSVGDEGISQEDLKIRRASLRKDAIFGNSKSLLDNLRQGRNKDPPVFSDYTDGDYDDDGDGDGDDDDDDNDSAAPLANASVQDSAGESTGSWNDASMDSSGGSSAQADASRMRRRWGNTQKPVMASKSSTQARRETSKGFKRLLTFGKKHKGGVAEGQLADWVSASTASEGEDDGIVTDLAKSRVGASHCHYVHDDQFYDQGGRSFFSISSMRAKGTKSRPV